jgi:hypothetical protein
VPDGFLFEHLPEWGWVHHRCVECGWPHERRSVSERERERHFREHQGSRKRALDRARDANLRDARKARRQQRRENEEAYGEN